MSQSFEEYCEAQAKQGDGSFAIAFAVLQLAKQQECVVRALSNIGIGQDLHSPGALVHLGSKVTEAAQIIGGRLAQIADSLPGDRRAN